MGILNLGARVRGTSQALYARSSQKGPHHASNQKRSAAVQELKTHACHSQGHRRSNRRLGPFSLPSLPSSNPRLDPSPFSIARAPCGIGHGTMVVRRNNPKERRVMDGLVREMLGHVQRISGHLSLHSHGQISDASDLLVRCGTLASLSANSLPANIQIG